MLGYKGVAAAVSPARDALQAFPTNTSQEDAIHLHAQPEQDRELSKEPVRPLHLYAPTIHISFFHSWMTRVVAAVANARRPWILREQQRYGF